MTHPIYWALVQSQPGIHPPWAEIGMHEIDYVRSDAWNREYGQGGEIAVWKLTVMGRILD